MRPAVVVVDAHRGSLTRYVFGNQLQKTHRYVHPDWTDGACAFSGDDVEYFRRYAPGEFYIGPPAPVPGTDDPGPNGAAPAMAVAA